MPVRQTVVQPLGLVITPNTYGQYPAGALQIARNVVIRAPGEVWASPAFSAAVPTFGAVSDVLRKLFTVDNGKVFAWTRTAGLVWTVSQNANACTLPTIAVPTGLFSDTGSIFPVRIRERMLSNTLTCGVFVCDKMDPLNAADRTQRSAGMPQPSLNLLAFSGGTIPNQVAVGYSSLIKRSFAEDYTVVSVPSPVYSIYNSAGFDIDVQCTVRWSATAGILAGDIVEVYRTDGINSTSIDVDPGETLKLVHTRTLSAGDIAAGFYTFLDTAICQAPLYQTAGRELYTNPGQETALGANRQPNICGAMAKFKGFSFFGDITERPRWTFTVPAGVGRNDVPPAPVNAWFHLNGLGIHAGVGTVTLASPVITAVPAADIVGVKIGQVWAGSTGVFAAGTSVIAVGAATITMSANALAGGATFALSDRILLDGNPINFGSYSLLLGAASNAPFIPNYEFTIDNKVSLNSLVYSTGITVTIEPVRPNQATMTVAATNGQNYQEPVPEYTGVAKTFTRKRTPQLLQWSKDSEPEHVPPGNETNVGAGTIVAMCATKNALWIFCTDGLYRLSGDAPPWRVDLVDPSCTLVAPQAFTQIRDVIYAYTNYGIVAITDGGINELTSQLLQELFPGPAYSANPLVVLERNELDDELLVTLGTNILYVYSTKQKAWTQLSSTGSQPETTDITALAFQRTPSSGQAVLLVGTSTPGVVPRYFAWNPPSATYLETEVRFQPWYGDDPLSMKQFIDRTFIFDPLDANKSVTSTERSISAGSGTLVSHNSDSYLTVGVPRTYAIAQSQAPGFDMNSSSTQYKFRGLSLRFVTTSDQAWRR